MSSTSVLTSASAATISVFDTVANTAQAVTKTIDGLGTGANMFHRMMVDMDTNHKKRSLLNQDHYETSLLKEMSDKLAAEDLKYQAKFAENAEYAKMFKENYEHLHAILHPKEA